MSTPPPPPLLDFRKLPNPTGYSNGQEPCNEPLTDPSGEVLGFCDRPVWPARHQSRWLRRPGHPGKPHVIEWWS